MKKTCSKCKKTKSIKNFGIDRKMKSGLRSQCRICVSVYYASVRHTARRRFTNYKKGAKKRDLHFDLVFVKFKEITNKNCVYCGGYSDSNLENFCGLDRVDSGKGYTQNNVFPCCWKCNDMKGTLTIQEFKKHIEKIYNYTPILTRNR